MKLPAQFISGWASAIHALGQEGDDRGADWSAAYEYLKGRLSSFEPEPQAFVVVKLTRHDGTEETFRAASGPGVATPPSEPSDGELREILAEVLKAEGASVEVDWNFTPAQWERAFMAAMREAARRASTP